MRSLIRRIKKTYHMAEPHESKAVLHNVVSLSRLQVITYLLPIVILPYLFRVLGPERFGLIAFAQAFIQYFMILTDYGFNICATKEISLCHDDRAKVSKVFSAVMTIKIVLVFLSSLILGTVVYFVPKFNNEWIVYVLSFGMVVGNAIFPVWFFQGIEKMKYIANLNIIGQIIYTGSIFCFVRAWQDYLMVPLINSFVLLITGLWGQYIVFRKFGVSFQWPGYKNIRYQLKGGWNIFISNVAINAYTTTRVFAVGLLTNNIMTGFYSIAERIANVAQRFPVSSFSRAILPPLGTIFHRNTMQSFEIMQQIQLITIIISLIFLPIIFIFAPFIVRLVCGGNYPPTVLSLRLLLISVFFISANAFRVQFLLVCGKTDIYSRIHVTMAMIGLPLIIILISYLSYVGAAMATVAIEAGIFTITYFTVKRLRFPK